MCYRTVTESPPSTTSQTSTVSSMLTTATATSTISLTATTSLTSTATLASTPVADPPSSPLVGFRGVDGGFDRVCRGGDSNDNNPSYFEVFDVDDLEACKDLCRSNSSCVGVESIGRTGL